MPKRWRFNRELITVGGHTLFITGTYYPGCPMRVYRDGSADPPDPDEVELEDWEYDQEDPHELPPSEDAIRERAYEVLPDIYADACDYPKED